MNKKIKEKWIKALLSGEYKQGRYDLRSRDDRFCCLGVLCDIVGVEWQAPEFQGGSYAAEGETYTLSDEMCQRTGVSREHAEILADMNDGGAQFPEIVEYIKEYL